MTKVFLVLMSAGVIWASVAGANEQQTGWGVGVGAVFMEQGYRGADSETQLFPIVFYQGQNFFWRGPELGYQVTDNITLYGEYRFDGFELEDSDYFAGMEERKGTLDVGASFTVDSEFGELTFSGQADALGEHKGYELGVRFSKGFQLLGGAISPFIEVNYLSDDLVDYYYGVRNSEANAFRPAYQAENTVNYTTGLSGVWVVAERQSIMASLTYTVLGDEIENSPIIEDGESTNLFMGYIYRF